MRSVQAQQPGHIVVESERHHHENDGQPTALQTDGERLSGIVLNAGWWWGSVFLVNIPLVVVLIGLVWFLVPNSKNPNGEALDPPGAVFSVIALGGLVFAIIEGPEWGWLSGGVLGTFALALLGGAAFIAWELRAAHPMLDPRLFKLRGFGMGSLAITLAFFCMFGTFFLISQYLQFVHGYTALGSAVRTLPAAVVMVIVSPRSPKIVARFGVRTAVRGGFLAITAGFIAMPLWTFIGASIVSRSINPTVVASPSTALATKAFASQARST